MIQVHLSELYFVFMVYDADLNAKYAYCIVYACCALGAHTISSLQATQARPFLYANLSDIPWLSTQSNYVCCVTETVFELKPTLYDAFITGDNKVLFAQVLSLYC